MKIEIKSWLTGGILFSIETEPMRLAVEEAIKTKTALSYADLSSADLRSANLSYANLRYADLSSANLSYADLRSADLSYANLRSANLSYADLSYANLRYADLSSANLSYANLGYANLRYADLSSANLSYANLSYAKGIVAERCTPLLMLLDQPGTIRAYKLVNSMGEGPFNGGLKYEIGVPLSVKKANRDVSEHCGAGINLATLDWCMREWQKGYRILICEFTASDIAAIPTATDGKFRVTACTPVGEKDLVQLGLVKAETKEVSDDVA